MSAEKELIVAPPQEMELAVYSAEKGLDPWLNKIRVKIDEFLAVVPDLKTVKGRKEIASMAYEVARTKTAIENKGKELSAEQKKVPARIDAERKRVWDILESWQKEVRKPLDDWQAAEDARVDRHNDRLDWLRNRDDGLADMPVLDIKARIDAVETVVIGPEWEEFEAEAAREKDKVLAILRAGLSKREQHDAAQAELTRLRAEAEAREQKEREERIAREAEERARREAEQKAQAEREASLRREQEAAAAAQRRELELQLQAEQAERAAVQAEVDRQAAIRQAEEERQAAARRAEEAAEQARQDERRRADAAAAEILRQQQARESDKAHKSKVMGAAKEALMSMNITEELAKAIVLKIARGEVPNITINF